MATIFENPISVAIRRAWERTNDTTLSVSVKQGQFRVNSVTYKAHTKDGRPKGKSTVTPLSEWGTAREAIEFLEYLGDLCEAHDAAR